MVLLVIFDPNTVIKQHFLRHIRSIHITEIDLRIYRYLALDFLLLTLIFVPLFVQGLRDNITGSLKYK